MWESGKIGSLELPNRFIRSATAEFWANNDDGTITPEYFDLYSDLAQGEIGLIISGHLYVIDEGKAHVHMGGLSHDFHIEKLKQLTDMIHEKGGRIAAQLNHGGAYSVSKKGPSLEEEKQTRMMNGEDIENVITGFGKAAHRAKKAGYDAIQIHSAHGYLLSQFLSARGNRRNDDWGGSIENRSRLLVSVYEAVRKVVGNNYPVLVKMNGSDDPYEGFPVDEAIKVVKVLVKEGIDAVEISGMKSTRVIKEKEEGYYTSTGRIVKNHLGDVPLILVGGHRTYSKIQELHNEFADYLSLCRPFIREPDLVVKFKEGKERADCISCSKCIRNREEGIVKCMVI
jgi:2,4-dienoyl-CoA reductase-like NADH-dependent reductase (Old Yellow Enzyme family)